VVGRIPCFIQLSFACESLAIIHFRSLAFYRAFRFIDGGFVMVAHHGGLLLFPEPWNNLKGPGSPGPFINLRNQQADDDGYSVPLRTASFTSPTAL
jgi:hypothetical protein